MYVSKGFAAKIRNKASETPSKAPMIRADEAEELCLLCCIPSAIFVLLLLYVGELLLNSGSEMGK